MDTKPLEIGTPVVVSLAGMKILASILHYNLGNQALPTIASLLAQTYPHLHVQVLDNASSKESVDRIRHAYPDLDLIVLPVNVGYTGGNNIALERGLREGYDAVLVCNHDILVQPDAVEKLAELVGANPGAGVVGGIEIGDASGQIRAAGAARFPSWRVRARWRKVLPERRALLGHPVKCVQGAFVLFTRTALTSGIRFDDNLFMYWDEVELGYELRDRGLAAYVDDRVEVRHRNTPFSLDVRAGYFHQRNRLYLAAKRFSPIAKWSYVAYSTLVELPAKVLLRTLQGHGQFAWACVLGQWDAFRGRLGPGRLGRLPGESQSASSQR